MGDFPALPTEINARGDELWEWAARAARHTHITARIREINVDLSARPRCGECEHWMKSRECPREHNVGGFSRGPSMADPTCPQFLIDHRSAERINTLHDERRELRATLGERA